VLRKKFNTIFNNTINFAAVIAAVLIFFITIAVLVEIALRYFFNLPQAWVLETVEYCLLYITFLGAAWVLKRDGHVKLDILIIRLKPRNQLIVNIITSVIGALIFLSIAIYGVLVTWDDVVRDLWIASELEPPRAPIIAIIPIGSLLLFAQFLRKTHGQIRSWETSRDK
jgi:TRAP-type C4-dicarboxylate transport system permease small subunit